MSKNKNFRVIVIGGGATGAGVARDCALRGIKVLLLEKSGIAAGATGRNHGLLHSGARYAVTDKESAVECIAENQILRKIASHCVEDTQGLFISLPEDDLAYQKKFIESCNDAGIKAEAIEPKLAIRMEPAVNPALIGAVTVPDGAVDPFRLASSNVIDAIEHGAQVRTYCEVVSLIIKNGAVVGVKIFDKLANAEEEIYADLVVNAGGIWGQKIAEYADLKIKMFPAKGSLLIFAHRTNSVVINRCRKPSNADILVPGDTISLIGTTSTRVPYDEIDNMYVTKDEVDLLWSEGIKLAPSLANTRILRAYAGVRPLVAKDGDETGRELSRGIVLLDHETRDGLKGFITITGGKLMTYRLMAEEATNLVCKKLGVNKPCITAETPLPGSRTSKQQAQETIMSLPLPTRKSIVDRQGDLAREIKPKHNDATLICECEQVSLAEAEFAINKLNVKNLPDLRARTRLGLGTCQGELCACRAMGVMKKVKGTSVAESKNEIKKFMAERWKGVRPILWGDAMRESQFTSWIYDNVLGLDATKTQK